jgi:hypothetical protein
MKNLNKKEAAQEVPVQEQFAGKCVYCNIVNEVVIPVKLKELPCFCMYCGEEITYIKMELYLQG